MFLNVIDFMEENIIFNTNQINNPESGDITYTFHQNGNKLWINNQLQFLG